MKKNIIIASLAVLAATFGGVHSATAAASASDNSSNSPYNGSNWANESNGGTGFNPWSQTVDTTNGGYAGFFVYDSTQNGAVPSNGINVNGSSFGMFAANGGVGNAYRPFTADVTSGSPSLQLNQQFTISIDNGYVDNGSIGFSLQDANGNDRFKFSYASGDYHIFDATRTDDKTSDSGIGYTDGGLTVSYTVTGANTYVLTVVRHSSTSDAAGTSGPQQTFSFSGTDSGTPSTFDIAQLHVFDANGVSDPPDQPGYHNYYINGLSITTVPEPTSIGLAAGALLVLRRRRRSMVV